jgi:hypothetical protein
MHFKTGDKVRRRRGTLGATGETGIVIAMDTEMIDGFLIVTVRFPGRTESFNWDVYEPMPETV